MGDMGGSQGYRGLLRVPSYPALISSVALARLANSMSQVGVTRQYRELLSRARGIPFLNTESYDLDQYVVGKALDGLFHVVADEEKKIRTNPTARVTDLLREVFGSRSARQR